MRSKLLELPFQPRYALPGAIAFRRELQRVLPILITLRLHGEDVLPTLIAFLPGGERLLTKLAGLDLELCDAAA